MAEIIKNNRISGTDIWDLTVSAPEIAKEAAAGQFVNLYTGDSAYLLPRPISICRVDAQNGTVRMLFQAVGRGTKLFSQLKTQDYIKIMGPLGNGFTIHESGDASLLIGGGIGLPPLLELAARIKGRRLVYIGSKSSPVILKEEFKALGCEVFVSTDDGSEGFKGNVIELIKKNSLKFNNAYACGPRPMLRGAAMWAEESGINLQVSMEERMACGIGACVGCTVKIKAEDGFDNKKVCKDGPVFLSGEVLWDE